MSNFDGKTVVVTGAGRSLGKALSMALAERGATVHLSARSLETATEVQNAINSSGDKKAYAYQCDISNPGDVKKFHSEVASNTDTVDILINNAAYWLEGELEEVSDDEIAETINSTVTGTILITKYFLPLVKKSSTPDIVTMVSKSGIKDHGDCYAHEAYHAAKHGQAGFVHRLKQTHPGIRVISLYPTNFDSDVDYDSDDWKNPVDPKSGENMNSKSIVNAILFALEQDRICTIESMTIENTRMT